MNSIKGNIVFDIVCLDLEGVLVPEIWINVAERLNIEALRATTRDIPDYDVLMQQRLRILDEHQLTLHDIQRVIADMGPLPGAREFLDWIRERYQLIILSDTFYEFAHPLMRQLGWPTLFCHKLEVDATGRIGAYRLRMPDQKTEAVRRLHELNFTVVAAGDSYNDTGMLAEADRGVFFDAPKSIQVQFPQFQATHSYEELKAEITRR